MAKKPAKSAKKKTAAVAKKPAAKTSARRPAAAKKPTRTAAKAPASRTTAAKKPQGALAQAAALFRPVKQSVTIRLDSDVVSWFKKQADKYQTEINSVLRKHMTKKG